MKQSKEEKQDRWCPDLTGCGTFEDEDGNKYESLKDYLEAKARREQQQQRRTA